MLVGTVLLGLLPGCYYFWWSRHMKPRPEDRKDATIEEGSGVIGSLPELEHLAIRARYGGFRHLPCGSVRRLAVGARVLARVQLCHRLHGREQARRTGLSGQV